MRIGVTGYNGRLGKVLVDVYGYEPCDWNTAPGFDVIVHTKAYTDVDGAEQDIVRCVSLNVIDTSILRKITKAKIIYLSTDFIFDGQDGPYSEDYLPRPLSVYGMSKLLGEKTLREDDLIIRTTVLYGGHKLDFVTWVLDQLRVDKPVKIAPGYGTTPINVYHLAEAIQWLIKNPVNRHIINVASTDRHMTRFVFAQRIAEIFGYTSNDVWGVDHEFGLAKRPRMAGLDVSLALRLGVPLYDVDEGLKLMKEMRDVSNY